MSSTILWRLWWKEYRMQRAFWISIAVLTVFLQVLVQVNQTPANRDPHFLIFYAMAVLLPGFYALGCGATLFATEHETGTYGFQRSLPVSAWGLFGAKVAFAVLSTMAMMGLLWSIAWLISVGNVPRVDELVELWGILGFLAVELLLWGIFFSLLMKRPLTAAILGVLAASVSTQFLLAWLDPDNLSVSTYFDLLPYRAVLASVVALVDVALGYRWFGEATGVSRGAARLGRLAGEREETPEQIDVLPSPSSAMARLIWQQCRQSARTILVLFALLIPLAVFVIGQWIEIWFGDQFGSRAAPVTFFGGIGVLLAYLVVPLIGSCVFQADQHRQQFRFLTEHGARPGQVWLSRQLVFLGVVLLGTVLAFPIVLLLLSFDRWPLRQEELLLLGCLLGYIVVAYLCGQLCSMFSRSALLAGFFAVVMTSAYCGWAALMFLTQISWLWSVVPVPLLMLLATRLRTPGWLLERNTLRAWLKPLSVVILPMIGTIVGVCMYRVYEIPYVDPPFSVEEFTRPATAEEMETVELYREAWDAYEPFPAATPQEGPLDFEKLIIIDPETEPSELQLAWIESERSVITSLLEISQRAECDNYEPIWRIRPQAARDRYQRIAPLLIIDAKRLQSQGDLDAAWQRYLAVFRISVHLDHRAQLGWGHSMELQTYKHLPYWAADAKQTPERIRAAMEQLDEIDKTRPSRTDHMKHHYVQARRFIMLDPDLLTEEGFDERDLVLYTMLMKLIPWEQARAMRLLNQRAGADFRAIEKAEREAAQGKPIRLGVLPNLDHFSHWKEEVDRTWLVRYGGIGVREWSGLMRVETQKRIVRLQLAAEAFKAEHGQLPETLDELVGTYLDRLPVDPRTGRPFVYFPQGLPAPIRDVHETELMPANTPFLCAPGWRILDPEESLVEIIQEELRDSQDPFLEWESGELFPVP